MSILTYNQYQCSILNNLHLPKLAHQSQLAAFVICKPKVLATAKLYSKGVAEQDYNLLYNGPSFTKILIFCPSSLESKKSHLKFAQLGTPVLQQQYFV